jgi:hypothetical protein
MRQISGYFEDRWSEKGLEIPVPSFGHLSDLFSGVSVETKQYCDKISRIKRCIGEALLTQKIESQNNERIVISNIINKFNAIYPPEQSLLEESLLVQRGTYSTF